MVDLRVVNDLADDEEPALFENFARGVSEIDRALVPVTKAELLGEADNGVANFNDSAGATHFVDDVAAIMLINLLLHGRHYVGRTQVDLFARRRSAEPDGQSPDEIRIPARTHTSNPSDNRRNVRRNCRCTA